MQFELVLERGRQWCAAAVVVDPEDVEMLSDLIIAAANEALRAAAADKSEQMEKLFVCTYYGTEVDF